MKATVRDAFTGELISTHQMPRMTGICFDVPPTTRRVNVNWEYESVDTETVADLQRELHAPEPADGEHSETAPNSPRTGSNRKSD